MRRLLPLILSIALLGGTTTADGKTASSPGSYGARTTYSADEVREMVDAVREEAAAAIVEAWNDGYKAGVLEYAPQAEGLRAVSESLRRESGRLTVPVWHVPVWAAAGVAAGFIGGFWVWKGLR